MKTILENATAIHNPANIQSAGHGYRFLTRGELDATPLGTEYYCSTLKKWVPIIWASRITSFDAWPFITYRVKGSSYDQQAATFLEKHGLRFRATLSDSKTPAWGEDGKHGHHYRVTISRHSDAPQLYPEPVEGFPQKTRSNRLVFDFWGSLNDAKKLSETSKVLQNLQLQRQNVDQWSKNTFDLNYGDEMKAREKAVQDCHPSAYDVLSCISSDAHTPETFADFCADYGYEQDSIKALQTFRRVDRFAKRLRAFFTAQELEDLSQIQ